MPSRIDITRRLVFVTLATACLSTGVAGAEIKIPPAGGIVLAPDTTTLVVSVPSEGKLLYFNAGTEKKVKEVEVDFKPFSLAVQGKLLFASTKGAATVHVLDLETGKEQREIKTSEDPILSLACHPSKGLLYATTDSDVVLAIDPANGKVTKTKARGQMIVIDPVDAKFVYTGIQKPIRDQLVIEEGPNKQIKVSLAVVNARALMLKFAVDGTDLKPLAFQDNAAINGFALAVSGDGKRIAMAGGGGWVAKNSPKTSSSIAVFETSDLKTMVGEVDCGEQYSISFHPVLNLGVAVRRGNDLIVFNGKSLAEKEVIKAPGGMGSVHYAARGTKLIQIVGSGVDSIVSFHPLKLSDGDKATLKTAYSKK